MRPIRLRDFIEDREGWLYAVAAYDNDDRVGCVLRYIPDPSGDRIRPDGERFQKVTFEVAYRRIAEEKPAYAGPVHRVPISDVRHVYKPEEQFGALCRRDQRVNEISDVLALAPGTAGCTGSLLCCLATAGSDIDLVVYGDAWFTARDALMRAIQRGAIRGISEDLWKKIYEKRLPDLTFEEFVLHERRKWNRGEIWGTYFDLLYTRAYDEPGAASPEKGVVKGNLRIEAEVTDATLAFDYPAQYLVCHDTISRVLCFTHTYSGQALTGEIIEAAGVCERHGDEDWLIVGTSREPRGEYIRSLTLLEGETSTQSE
ncbi:MAG: DNA polymerase subunit beta [Methanomicrobiales archaeon]|nr:DNA polymerase subunit beta [Methanomicrobiales archaeon]